MFVIAARWDEESGGCVVYKIDTAFLEATFFFTMGFDAIILILTTAALFRHANARSGLWNLLFRDGLVYFLVTFTCNAVPAILNVLKLNNVMNLIAAVPAATIAAIAACRLVVRLQDFHKTDPFMQSSQLTNEAPFSLQKGNARSPISPRFNGVSRPEIRVTTDHITMQDFSPTGTTAVKSPYGSLRSLHDIESKGAEVYYDKMEKDSEDDTRSPVV